MSSGTQVIQDALEEIGAHSVVSPAPPEAIVRGRDRLNSMLQGWEDEGIKLEIIPLDAPGDELAEPQGTYNAIVYNLAVLLAPAFNRPVTPDLRSLANKLYNKISDVYTVLEIPSRKVSTTLPKGAGNSKGPFPRPFFTDGGPLDA